MVEHWICGSEVGVWLFLQATESCRGDHEGAHVVWRVGVGVDVFEAVCWGGHVLLGVVVADEVHHWGGISCLQG